MEEFFKKNLKKTNILTILEEKCFSSSSDSCFEHQWLSPIPETTTH